MAPSRPTLLDLEEQTGREVAVLLTDIKELVATQLVAEEAPDCFRFRHALTREAVYSQLLSTERRNHHRARSVQGLRPRELRDDR